MPIGSWDNWVFYAKNSGHIWSGIEGKEVKVLTKHGNAFVRDLGFILCAVGN